jgi:hypothetical protein
VGSSITDPTDMYILTLPLHLLTVWMGLRSMPSLLLVTNLQGCSPCFLDPWVSKTYDPSFCIFCMPGPYNYKWYKHHHLSCLCSSKSCCCVSPSLNMCTLRVVWPVNSPTATLGFGPEPRDSPSLGSDTSQTPAAKVTSTLCYQN